MPTDQSDEVTEPDEYFRKHKQYRMCRKMGHAFEPAHDGYFVERDSGAYYQRLKCIRGCGIPATDTWHPVTGERIGQRYIEYGAQPEYLAKGTRISRVDARLWDFNNVKARPEPVTSINKHARGSRKKVG